MTTFSAPPPLRRAQFGLVNSYLVPEEDGWTLIDAGLPGLERHVLSVLRRTGLALRRVALTHAHSDHIGSVDALQAALPELEVLVGVNDVALLAENKVKATPHRRLRGGDRVGSLRVIDTPGHSPGHLAFFDERDGTLYAGDTFVNLPGLRVASVPNLLFPFPTQATHDRAQTTHSARLLLDVPAKFLAVGHGRIVADPPRAMRRAVERAEAVQNRGH